MFGLSAAAVGGIAAGAGAIGGAIISSKGAKSAAQTQADAANQANQVQLDIFNKQTDLNAPFRDTGLDAKNRLAFLLGLGGQNPGAAPAGPSATFGGLSPQMLSPGSDGVFSPQQGESADAIRARLAGQFTTQSSPNAFTWDWNTNQKVPIPGSQTVDENGLNAAVQAEMARQQQQQQPTTQAPAMDANGQPLPPQANNLSGFGSLAQPFSQADFSADGAPKSGPFDQAAPQATPYGQFGDTTHLAGFQDMPAFNADMMKDDPGYQFRLDQGMKGVANKYAGTGSFLSGGALKGLQDYAQNDASNEYGAAFGRYQTQRGNNLQDFLTNQNTDQLNRSNALGNYQTNQATNQQNFANANTGWNNQMAQFSLNRNNALQDYTGANDRFQQNRGNVINPLLSLLGAGQTATGQVSNAAQNFGNQSSAAIQAAGNASAAGQVGSANAINGGIGSAINGFNNNQLMNLLRQPSTGSSLFSNSALGSSGFGSGLAFGNQDLGQNF